MPHFSAVKACVFDAYGTLFDVHSPAARALNEIGPAAAQFSELWRRKQLEYTWLRSLMGVHADFWRVTQDALDYALEASALEGVGLRAQLLDSFRTLDAYADAAPALSALRSAGLRTAILSNGTPDLLTQAVSSAGVADLFDEVLSVEAAGVYKPSPAVYALATQAFSLEPSDIAFVSSNGWDVAGAAQFGFLAIHVNRANAPAERLPTAPRAVIGSLAQLPALISA